MRMRLLSCELNRSHASSQPCQTALCLPATLSEPPHTELARELRDHAHCTSGNYYLTLSTSRSAGEAPKAVSHSSPPACGTAAAVAPSVAGQMQMQPVHLAAVVFAHLALGSFCSAQEGCVIPVTIHATQSNITLGGRVTKPLAVDIISLPPAASLGGTVYVVLPQGQYETCNWLGGGGACLAVVPCAAFQHFYVPMLRFKATARTHQATPVILASFGLQRHAPMPQHCCLLPWPMHSWHSQRGSRTAWRLCQTPSMPVSVLAGAWSATLRPRACKASR